VKAKLQARLMDGGDSWRKEWRENDAACRFVLDCDSQGALDDDSMDVDEDDAPAGKRGGGGAAGKRRAVTVKAPQGKGGKKGADLCPLLHLLKLVLVQEGQPLRANNKFACVHLV
jgi:hypothetical protein